MRIEFRSDPDGTQTITVETDDMVPGLEASPWVDQWLQAVRILIEALATPRVSIEKEIHVH